MTAPIRFGVLTVSDRSSRGERPDTSGPALVALIRQNGWLPTRIAIVPDEVDTLINTLSQWADSGDLDVILTTGGTGFSPRDITPEATLAVVTRLAPGIAEGLRAESLKITPHAMLSRGMAGIRGRVLIVNFPGSPKAARENFALLQPVIAHAVQLLQEDVNAEAGHEIQSLN